MAVFRHSHGEDTLSLYFQYLPFENATFSTCALVVAIPPNPCFVSFIQWNDTKSTAKGVPFWHPILFKNLIFELFQLGLPRGCPGRFGVVSGRSGFDFWPTRDRFGVDFGSDFGFDCGSTHSIHHIFVSFSGRPGVDHSTTRSFDHTIIYLHDHMTQWSYDHIITTRSHDHLTIWSYDHTHIWQYVHMITWSYDHMIIWSYDHQIITWSYDHMITI